MSQTPPLPTAILVVEDDLLVRDMVVEILRDAGFTVCDAACAEDALKMLAKRHVDAVVTDVDMPGEVDGVSLAWRISEWKPEIGVVLTSGRTPRPFPQGMKFVAKPFTARDLVRSVMTLLGPRLYATS